MKVEGPSQVLRDLAIAIDLLKSAERNLGDLCWIVSPCGCIGCRIREFLATRGELQELPAQGSTPAQAPAPEAGQ